MEAPEKSQDHSDEQAAFDFSEKYELVKKIGNRLIYAHTTYYEVEEPDYEQFITEDDTPVDNIFSEKQQRLLIDPLHANEWTNRDFLASSNVGIYYSVNDSPIVPDMFLSFDVKAPEEWFEKKNRCYFIWRFGKPPELVVEVISNKIGKETDQKMEIYAQIGVLYYVLIDPYLNLFDTRLQVFRLSGKTYEPISDENFFMTEIQLGIKLWEGLFEKHQAPWGRWCSKEGDVLKTGAERTTELSASLSQAQKETEEERKRTEAEKQKAEAEKQKAETEKQRAEAEKQRADKLEALLRKMGLDPNEQ